MVDGRGWKSVVRLMQEFLENKDEKTTKKCKYDMYSK